MRYIASIDWLFAKETSDIAERVRLAAKAGLQGVEFRQWRDKPIDAIMAALTETGLPLVALASGQAEPPAPLTDLARHGEYLEALRQSVDVARKLGATVLIAEAGPDIAGRERTELRAALVEGLSQAADVLEGTGMVLALEPLNSLIDNPGCFLSSTTEGLDIVDEVGRPEIRLLYSLYHSAVMGEDIAKVLTNRLDRVAHCHLADTPGRHEPGSGGLDWRACVAWLEANGYDGCIGLEYRPTGDTADSLQAVLTA
ncbi:TIM barrel protein [Pleomorphomonas carboxyditropha]|uniref:Hydroxypyruvate isomerase n=1 Tax=Pleomorphomonas carboxyditropha TaxID=2023338 RepID=A0A2G9WV13_9HYPH|nr:TIM barrel protein [Pleomorphomonas carboxyditropha]PIO98561.1 hydroxypyruvate isomerase [Pleomorphomonas carboxyditropha]